MKKTIFFAEQFADMVANGQKRQTLRASDDYLHWDIGEQFELRAGSSARPGRLLGIAMFTGVSEVMLYDHRFEKICPSCRESKSTSNPFTLDQLAKQDGFKDWNMMVAWLREKYKKPLKGLPFIGVLITWEVIQ